MELRGILQAQLADRVADLGKLALRDLSRRFVGVDDIKPLPDPAPLVVPFDDLKHKLVGVVIVVLAVLFLGNVVTWDGERDLLGFGTAIALVIAALTWFLNSAAKKPAAKGRDMSSEAADGDLASKP